MLNKGFGQVPQPPRTNRGVIVTNQSDNKIPLPKTVSIGWLAGSTKEGKMPELIDFLSTTFSDQFVRFGRAAGNGYEDSFRSAKGIIINFSPDRVDYNLIIPQRVLASVPLSEVRFVMQYLDIEYKFNCTRLDSTVDDNEKNITKERIYEAYLKKNHRAASHQFGWRESQNSNKQDGFTFTAGSRQSERYLRIYDKTAESDGEIDATRIELELKGSQAQRHFKKFVESDISAWLQLAIGCIRAAIDFVNTLVDSNVSRCPLLFWWERVVGEYQKYSLPLPKPVHTVGKVLDFIHHQFGSTLAFLPKYFGADEAITLLKSIASEYENKLNIKQKLLLAYPSGS